MAKTRARTAFAQLMLGVTIFLEACGAQSVAAGASRWTVEIVGPEQITVHADRAPLADVIAEVARRTGLEVTWLGARGDEPVTVRVDRLHLEGALARLLKGRNHSVFLAEGRPARVVIGSLTASGETRAHSAEPPRESEEMPGDRVPAVDMEFEREARAAESAPARA
jgi:hypothetical protein